MSKYAADDYEGELNINEEEEKKPKLKGGDPGQARIPTGAKCVIDPRGGFQSKWDMLMIILLVFTAIVTPWEVAFLEPAWNFLYGLNRVVDFGFLLDLVIQFFTPFYSDDDMGYVVDHWRIAKHYLSGWFIIDFTSILPFDTVSMVLEDQAAALGETGDTDLSMLRILRTIRLARLAKLLRVLKGSRIFKRWESRIGMQYSTMTLIKWCVFVLVLCHWLACAWHTVIQVEESVLYGQEFNWRKNYGIGVATPWERYLTSLYWSTMTCTTIGYGDVTPQTNAERGLAVFAMCIGSATYAYVVGNICGLIATMDQATTEFNASMDDLNLYMEENFVPRELRIRLREYFMYAKGIGRQMYYAKLYDKMSPALRGELAYFINQHWISNVPFLSRAGHLSGQISEEEHRLFITDVAMHLDAEAYGPQEHIVKMGEKAEKMYIMQRGVVAKQGSIISGGKYFGEDIILKAGRRTYTVRALTFTDVFVLKKNDLFKILDSANYFGIQDQIRRAALCESFKNTFIRLAHLKAGIKGSKYVAVAEEATMGGSRPGSAARSARSKPETSSVTQAAEREIQISRKASDTASINNNQQMLASPSPVHQNQIVPAGSPMPSIQSPSPGRRKSVQGGRNTMGSSTGNYSRSKPPRILEMLQSRHDELVQAIRGLAQRSDRRADSIEDRMNRMTSNAMMGLVLMCILLGGMCVGLLISGSGAGTASQ